MSNIFTVVTLDDDFFNLAKKKFHNVYKQSIQSYIPKKKTVFYVSPANSLGFMDGGIDKILSRILFSGIEPIVISSIIKHGKRNINSQPYLPIGSSIILKTSSIEPHILHLNTFLVVAPTMLVPQNVENTNNCYYATMATLYNIFINSNFTDCEVIFTSMCCGYGNMTAENSLNQFLKGVKDFHNYKPFYSSPYVILHEPNLSEQPNVAENSRFKSIE